MFLISENKCKKLKPNIAHANFFVQKLHTETLDPVFTWILTLNPNDRCPILKTWNLKVLKNSTYEVHITMKKIEWQSLNDLNSRHAD